MSRTLLIQLITCCLILATKAGSAQKSPFAKMESISLEKAIITDGFWADRQKTNRDISLEVLWDHATNADYGYSLSNFKIAAGLKEGKQQGVPWQDAWMYKWIETASYEYASSKDEALLKKMDEVIPFIAQAQEDDGYIATQVTAGKYERRWIKPDNHELYNMGHLLTAAAVNHRYTGRTDLLEVANKAAAFCLKQFREHPNVMWEYPLNPSIIMGAVELYRATGNQDCLELARHIVDLRGSKYQPDSVSSNWGRPEWGTIEQYQGGRDLYQNFIPLRKEKEVVGHAVFFTYLYAGATDVFLENGDESLLHALEHLWEDLTEKKMYVTGGVSPVHKGPVTRNFDGDRRQVCRWEPIHEGIVAPFDLPNTTAYNETCGMVGNMMWNWRMLQATGNPRYAEIMELSWYNSILSGVELDGSKWSYTNPLRWQGEEHELWSHDYHHRHVPGIRHICCPTNVMRNISAFQGYLFSQSDKTVWVHHYAEAEAELDKLGVKLKMETDYPWDGKIVLTIQEAPTELVQLKLRIPSWSASTVLLVNEKQIENELISGTYTTLKKEWKKGDRIELELQMEVQLLAGDHRSEHIRNQVAVKRGPIVYCLESNDVEGDVEFERLSLDLNADFIPEYRADLLGGITVLKTTALALSESEKVLGQYQDIREQTKTAIDVELIPYYSWNNREEPKMSVWLPISR